MEHACGKKHQILIVNDNPYSFILNNNPKSILQIEGAKDIALELNSLSKSFNMAGWRIGMLCGSQQNINKVLKILMVFEILPSLLAHTLCIGD